MNKGKGKFIEVYLYTGTHKVREFQLPQHRSVLEDDGDLMKQTKMTAYSMVFSKFEKVNPGNFS
jgi:hypothetical protein